MSLLYIYTKDNYVTSVTFFRENNFIQFLSKCEAYVVARLNPQGDGDFSSKGLLVVFERLGNRNPFDVPKLQSS